MFTIIGEPYHFFGDYAPACEGYAGSDFYRTHFRSATVKKSLHGFRHACYEDGTQSGIAKTHRQWLLRGEGCDREMSQRPADVVCEYHNSRIR